MPRLPLTLSVDLDPARPTAASEFVLRLTVRNEGDRVARGVYIGTTGPWDRYAIRGVAPRGAVLARSAAGWHITSPADIPAGGSITIEVTARADDPGVEQLTFTVREALPGEL
jgi:hypothetical protein